MHWANEKKTTSQWVGETGTQSCLNPSPSAVTHNLEKIQNSELLFKD